MNTYDILGLSAPSDSIINRNKSIRGGKRKSIQTAGDESKTEHNIEELKHNKNITLHCVNNDAVVETYEPKITRPTVSIYEYSEIHTMLALYLDAQKSIANYTNEVEIRGNVNPVELAFHLLLEGKWDATLDRGYELVSYSKLKYNPQWQRTIEHYFNEQHEIQQNELFVPLGLM